MNFKKILVLTLLSLSVFSLSARSVDMETARRAAQNYLRYNDLHCPGFVLRQTLRTPSGTPCMYIFDIDREGFVLVSALTDVTPVLGYSYNGPFDTANANLRSWIASYHSDIARIATQDPASKGAYRNADARAEWEALLQGDAAFYSAKGGAKSVQPLLSSQWNQDNNNNQFCPVMPNGEHAVVGCVALAMAQIMRYHGYPVTGFGTSSYVHYYYGPQTAVHDTVHFDYANMPNKLYYNSSAVQKRAVAMLCYHCGVSVSMEYENPNHTSGSGALSEDVPDGFAHFGYFNAQYRNIRSYSDAEWHALLRHELDLGRPIYYSGQSSDGGHAFVCDGYRTSDNKFHFNFGWGGSGDGFYSTTNLNGFTANQRAVINIVPSHLAANQSTYYVTPDGTGDGSSWSSPTCRLDCAIQARNIYKGGQVWVVEGTYYGDTVGSAAFLMGNGVSVYGGFNGTETSASQAMPKDRPAILDGRNERTVVSNPSTLTKSTTWKGIVIQHGMAEDRPAVSVGANLTMQYCTLRDNTATDYGGSILTVNSGTIKNCNILHNTSNGNIANYSRGDLWMCSFENNTCATVLRAGGTEAKNLLIAHNDGDGVDATSGGTLTNCDIVSNSGIGVRTGSGTTMHNCVVWNNGTPVQGTHSGRITFCAIEGSEYAEDGNISLSSSNTENSGTRLAPRFMLAGSTRGIVPDGTDNFRPASGSPLVNAGDTNTSFLSQLDLDRNTRLGDGRVDIGCYEYYPTAADHPEADIALTLHPNPADNLVTVEGGNVRQIDVLDITGRQRLTLRDTDSVSLGAMPRGVYILRITTDEGVAVRRVIKK